jgi:hypothetical protein
MLLNSRTRMTEVLSSDFPHWPQQPLQPHWPQHAASTALFPQKTSWSWWFDQYWSSFVESYGSSEIQIFTDIWNSGWYSFLLFWKLVDETQISKPQEYTDTYLKTNLTGIFLSVRPKLFVTFHYEIPCMIVNYIKQNHVIDLSDRKSTWNPLRYPFSNMTF